jgi:formylmethanofuran dehydrogenase subunit B
MGSAFIDGRPVELQAACAEAARLLDKSRLPLVAGLGTDITGARAAIRVAQRLGGVIDHMHSGALLRDLDVMREASMMVTTPAETRVRADVLLVVGHVPAEALAALQAGSGQADGQKIVWLCPARTSRRARNGTQALTIGRAPGELPAILAALRATVAGRAVGARPLAKAAALLTAARFGTAVWSAATLDALAIEMLCGLINDLNANTRFSGLPLPSDDNAAGVVQACGWLTGLPPRTGFARGSPEHDPWRFDGMRLVESGEADCVLWISAYRPAAPPWSRAVSTIALTAEGARFHSRPRVHVAVGRPGVDHDAVEYLAAAGSLAWTAAGAPRDTTSVDAALAAIAAALSGTDARPC